MSFTAKEKEKLIMFRGAIMMGEDSIRDKLENTSNKKLKNQLNRRLDTLESKSALAADKVAALCLAAKNLNDYKKQQKKSNTSVTNTSLNSLTVASNMARFSYRQSNILGPVDLQRLAPPQERVQALTDGSESKESVSNTALCNYEPT